MAFTQFKFIVFLAIFCLLLWMNKLLFFLNEKRFVFVNKLLLLLGSYSFIAFANWKFCVFLFLTTLLIFASGIGIKRKPEWGKKILFCTVSLILIQLGVFKYFNFVMETISNLSGGNAMVLQLIVPIGISFYSFTAISYVVDVFQKKVEPSNSFLDVALYLSFFPKLGSGPIVRADKFLSQLDKEHCISLNNFEIGIQIVVVGLFKKMVLADRLSVFVNDVFAVPNAFTGMTCLLAMISYSLQIYFDFSGYSDIAIGVAKICGFEFDKNFNLPYLSQNPTEFWKRWHISLSSWLQEYLYYSLGGNRKGKLRTYANLLLTMLLGGLWHGANWTFIFWGVIHGVGLILHKIFVKWKVKAFGSKNAGGIIWKLVSVIAMFVFATVCWVFFRAESLQNAVCMFASLLNGTQKISQMYTWTFVALLALFVESIVAIIHRKDDRVESEYPSLDLTRISHLVIFFTFIGITIMLAYVGDTAFIYGNF